ncbi:MAG: DNA/RNA nuclease SfsA [Gammaproteobacteria bacterium]|nr:DNA/RNA nuclease SfsA [Gammaproteobacteria bacterium]
MRFEPAFQQATMLRRYKRFLVDVSLADGTRETMHCANTGAMSACVYPGFPVYFSISDNPKRKLRGSLELVQTPDGHLVCVNTSQANRIVKEALATGFIEELAEYEFRSEVKIPDEPGRFDFGNDDVYVEVKNVTYLRGDLGVFPDAKSDRATKHVNALRRCVLRGKRAVLFFCVAHTGIDKVAIADDIDPLYDAAVRDAMAAGVEILAYRCQVTPKTLALDGSVPFLGSSSTVA